MKILDVPQSGSVAGVTSSRNRFGQYRRTRAVPVNPNTDAQVAARSRLSSLAQAWRGLSALTKAAWTAYAAANPRVDSLGQVIVLTGAQMYVSFNSQREAFGFAAADAVPVGVQPTAPVISDWTFTVGSECAITFTPTPLPADTALVVEVASPKSPGVTFVQDYRLIAVAPPASITPFNFYTEIQAKFGTIGEGVILWGRFSLFNESTGRSPYTLVQTAPAV